MGSDARAESRMTRLRAWWGGCDRCLTRGFHRAVIAQNRAALESMHFVSSDDSDLGNVIKDEREPAGQTP